MCRPRGRPFDPKHYPWDQPAHVEDREDALPQPPAEAEDKAGAEIAQAAGHKPEPEPARKVVTTACNATLPEGEGLREKTFVDFAHVKRQLPLLRVLEHLGLASRLQGSGAQRRCACPIHRADGRGRTFSVNLDEQAFHCFDASCGKQGDVIDLWAALHHLNLRDAALDLVQTFNLEPAPQQGTEKRHGEDRALRAEPQMRPTTRHWPRPLAVRAGVRERQPY